MRAVANLHQGHQSVLFVRNRASGGLQPVRIAVGPRGRVIHGELRRHEARSLRRGSIADAQAADHKVILRQFILQHLPVHCIVLGQLKLRMDAESKVHSTHRQAGHGGAHVQENTIDGGALLEAWPLRRGDDEMQWGAPEVGARAELAAGLLVISLEPEVRRVLLVVFINRFLHPLRHLFRQVSIEPSSFLTGIKLFQELLRQDLAGLALHDHDGPGLRVGRGRYTAQAFQDGGHNLLGDGLVLVESMGAVEGGHLPQGQRWQSLQSLHKLRVIILRQRLQRVGDLAVGRLLEQSFVHMRGSASSHGCWRQSERPGAPKP
mmetsp:Transcript_72450/g.169692  ORF Transcript_72450/g.169692 Transcript_72450/m.169692 type:complete len:320 (-) Transcript_72450:7-966(-)